MSLWSIVKASVIKDGKPSSSRIIGYFMSINITLSGISFIVIDIINAINSWKEKGAYEIPGTHVALFGMMLAHQLTLLGIYKALENQQSKIIPSVSSIAPVIEPSKEVAKEPIQKNETPEKPDKQPELPE